MTKLLKKIQEFLYARFGIFYSGPVLQDLYYVFDDAAPLATSPLATLTRADTDFFWSSFLLTPLTDDPNKLELLYSSDFWWGASIAIREQDSNRRVKFMPALLLSDDEEEVIDYFKERPQYVNLRGPIEYKPRESKAI